ncbi:uncharacterized protein [Palaemon carinicauda]|uniref:uncharacterized protein isoform X3 n=2 Tax=Palaemon carinicauda TaxID=392227 RepID=UPI0035B69C95
MRTKEKNIDLQIRRKSDSLKTMGQARRRLQPPWTSPAMLLVLCSLVPISWAAVTVPPLLEAQPPKGEVLFTVNHDPDQDPDPFTLPCKAKALPVPSYSWLKDGEPFNIEEEDDGKNRVEMVEGEGSLVFHDPKPGDEGDYQCIAENKVGKVHSDVAMVRRAVLGNFPKGDPRVVTAALGQPLGLPCTPPEGYPEPTVHWVLQNSDGSLRSLDSPRLTVDEEGTLWFSYITKEDASEDALYACAASSATSWYQMFLVHGEEGVPEVHEEAPDSGDVTSLNLPTEYRMGNWVYLNVSYPDDDDEVTLPEAPVAPVKQHVSAPEVTTLAGEDVKLYCVYGGYPVPTVKWWRESRADVENDQLEHNGKVLSLTDISEEDMGSYYCQASNEAGEGETHHFTVYVESAPHFVVEPDFVNLPEGESAIFHCEARGDPEPTITWTKDGEVMESHDTTIVFDTLSLDHKAVISCNASNDHGYVYKNVYLNVLSLPPEWMSEPEDVAVLAGSSAIIECEAFGSPDPDVTWYRVDDDEEVEIHDEDPRYDIKDDRLIIRSVDEHSDGRYICKAINKFGSIEGDAEVAIRSHTSVEVSVIHERVEAGDHVSLDCEVKYDEALEPEITWLHDEDEIDLDGDNYHLGKREKSGDDDDDDEEEDDDREETTWVLEIMQVHGEDSGVYTCRVKTDLDTASHDLILNVEDVPNPPKLKTVKCEDQAAFLEWASMGDNNAPLQGYVIQYITQFHPDDWKDAENQIPSSEMTYSVQMSPGMNYTFRLLAFNRVGMSNPSEDTYECASPGLPPSHHPNNVTVVPNAPGSLHISWDVMDQEEHNGADFHYKVLWRPLGNDTKDDEKETPEDENGDGGDDDEDGDEEAGGDDDDDKTEDGWQFMIIEDWEENEVDLENLPPYQEYQVVVEAHNIYGESPEPVVPILEHSGQDVPEDAPTEVEAIDADATEVVLTWDPVDEDSVHGLLLGYQIELWEADEDENDAQKILTTGPASRVDLTDLNPFTEYNARISAVNSAFTGPASSQVSFKTAEGESGPVTKFEVQQLGSESLLVNWEAPEETNGITRGYEVQYRLIDADGEEGPILEYTSGELKPDNTLIKLANLQEGGKYRVTVAAVNGAGSGEESSMEVQLQEMKPRRPAIPVFTWSLIQDDEDEVRDKDGDGDVDEEDVRNQNVIIGDTNNDGVIDKDDVLDVDNDGDIDEDDFNVADIDNDGDVDKDDVKAADRDDDGDVDVSDIGDEDGDGDFDGADVIAADEDGDGDIDASDDDEEDTLLEDRDQDGDIDRDDVTDLNRDGVIDEVDFAAADVDDDGDIDMDDLRIADKDGDGDIDAADLSDLDGDGRLDGDDLEVSDKDGDGDIDKEDFALRGVILTDVDGDGDIDKEDVIDTDNDGDIDEDDHAIADIDNDGDVDADDIKAADRDGDGDIDIADIGDEDGDGDFDGADVIAADEDGDGDIDASDDDEENVLLEDRDGDGDIDRHDVTDIDGDGDVDIDDLAAADVDDDGDVDMDDLRAADKDGDGDVDGADITDFDGDGKLDSDDLDLDDRDNDGDVDAKDYKFRNTLLADTDGDGDIDEDDVLDIDGDGDIDEADKNAADIDDDGDVDKEDVKQGDRDGDGDIDASDVSDVDGDGFIDEGDLDVKDRDGDGDVDAMDFSLRNVFLEDTDNDGDIDKDDVLDTDGDGDIDQDDFDVADIDNDGDVDVHDIRAADRDHDGDIDANDIGDEDGDGDIDGDDVIAADEDKDGDIDASDDNGESIILADTDKDGIIDKNDVKDINGDGVIDQKDLDAADVDNDGDFDADDIRAADKDGDLDVDAADITDVNGDGIVDGRDLLASDKDGDGDIDRNDFRNLDVFLKDTDRDGDIDEDDVIDTDFDGDVDQDDINAADVDNDGDVDRDDVIAADIDGDGDVDFRDIGDEDGDGDIDGDDLEMADRDGDGDVDAADDGRGVNVKINWQPDFDKHPGVDFYVEKRVQGATSWQQSPMERERLYQTLTGLDPRRSYEVRMVAKDGPYETPSNIILIPASEGVKRHPSAAEEFSHPEIETQEDPTVGAVMEETNPILWTWFIIAVMVAVTMICIVFFSMWVYSHRIARVAELRASLYEGYEPAKPEPVKEKPKEVDVEANKTDEVEDQMSANYQRNGAFGNRRSWYHVQLAAMMKRQETIQSVDSFASHDDDFAEYGDESMAIDLLSSVSLVTNPRHQRPPPAPRT